MPKEDKSSAATCVFKWGKEEKNFRKLGSKDGLAEVSKENVIRGGQKTQGQMDNLHISDRCFHSWIFAHNTDGSRS